MLDINFIRENLDKVSHSINARKVDVSLEKLIKIDDNRRELTTKVGELRAKRNSAARAKDIESGKKIKEELEGLEKELNEIEIKWRELMLHIPNILLEEVPIGDPTKNKVIRKSGEPKDFGFKIKDHIELGKSLDII